MTRKELWDLLKIKMKYFEFYKFYCCKCNKKINENEEYISFVNCEIDYDYDNLINCEDDLSHLCKECFIEGGK